MTSNKNNFTGPLITVGLPTYNRPDYFRLALKSCLDQDYPNFEIIVSDDSKDDQVRQIIDSFHSHRIRYIKNNPPLGIPVKLNDLLDKALGPWMVVLGDDDLFEPGYLSTMAALIDRHQNAALIRARSRLIDENGKFLKVDKLESNSMDPFEFMTTIFYPWYKIQISITGFMFRVESLKQLGGFLNFHQGYYIDRVAWAMLASRGITYFEPTPLVTVRINPVALSRNFDPDYNAFISAKEKVHHVVNRLFDDLSAQASIPADHKNMRIARTRFVEFMKEDSQHFLDRMFIYLLKKKVWFVFSEIRVMFRRIEKSQVPFFSLRRFHALSLCYLLISVLPWPLRIVSLSLIRKCRHILMLLFPPETFSTKNS